MKNDCCKEPIYTDSGDYKFCSKCLNIKNARVEKGKIVMDKNKDFELFYNALSVGFHLAKIQEIAPELIKTKEDWERFIKWLERHEIKGRKNMNT